MKYDSIICYLQEAYLHKDADDQKVKLEKDNSRHCKVLMAVLAD